MAVGEDSPGGGAGAEEVTEEVTAVLTAAPV